jgi:imidazolonepropionase-like amidohydrolase
MLDHYVIGPLRPAMGIKAEENIKDVLRRQAKVAADNIRRLHEAGVLVATGTDGGQGESLLSELEFLVEDTGLPPLTVLQMATSNAAKVLELDDRLGMVREGHLADLVLVDGRPDENIHDIRNIREVMKNGKLINRESLTHQWSY